MAHLLEFVVGDGTDDELVTFEVDPAELPDDLVLAARDGRTTAARATATLQVVLDQLKPSLQRVADVVRSMAPTEATVEFGLKMGGETGVIVAKGTAEANFAVTLVWK